MGGEDAHRHQVGVTQVVHEAPHVTVATRVDAVDLPHLHAERKGESERDRKKGGRGAERKSRQTDIQTGRKGKGGP